MADTPIAELMTPMPVTVGRDQKIAYAADLMRKHGFRHLPVLHGGTLLGMLSDRDVQLVLSLSDVDPEQVTVEEAMTAEAYAVGPKTPLREVVDEMIAHKYGSVVVMEGTKVTGIFTTVDALSGLARALRD